MSTHVETTSPQTTPLLQRVMRANALFSAISGAILVFTAPALARLMGIPWPLALTITGVLLLAYGPALWTLAGRADKVAWPGWLAVILDVLWVAGSAGLVFGGWLPLTTAGIWIIVVLADIVAVFAVLQFIGIRRLAASEN
ncbi:MAG: hypothetical protein ACOC9Z_00405 [Chloroflexota bacterium]